MFENLKKQIAKELIKNNSNIDNLDTYINELYNVCENFLKHIPEQTSYEFYEFAAKFLKYLLNEDYSFATNMSDIVDVFEACYIEINNVICALASQSGEDITEDLIKIISTAKSLNIVNNEEECEEFLYSIFTMTNYVWTNDNEWLHCDWNQVMLMNDFVKKIDSDSDTDGIIFYDDESIKELENDGVDTDWYQGPGTYDTFNEFTPVDLVSEFPDSESEENEDDPNFGIDALFSFLCVTGPDSADQALELIYNECGWVGHPEDEIEAGIDFPIYGIINQEEADWYNANMNAIFNHYDGDPNEFALRCIDPEQFDDENNDFDENEDTWLYNAEQELLEEYDYEITEEEITEWFEENRPNYSVSEWNVLKNYLEAEGWNIIENSDDKDDFVAIGYKTTSNFGGKEIQINDSGDCARIKFEDDTISDWLEIQYTNIDENGDFDENNLRAYIDIEGNNNIDDFEFLDEYMKY